MQGSKIGDPTVFVIFGGGGDLTLRKLIPALYSLFLDGRLGERFEVLGVGRKPLTDDSYRRQLREGVDKYSTRGKIDEKAWTDFAAHISFSKADLSNSEAFGSIGKELLAYDKKWGAKAARIYYLALPPDMIKPMAEGLAGAKLNLDRERARIVVEKPFGRDLESARELNQLLTQYFHESQIYRIDHYLGKETVQNILAFRFGKHAFRADLEPPLHRPRTDHGGGK